jgi:hypothetical protein
MIITEKIYDISTGEETIIEREETPQEETAREAWETEAAQRIADIEAKATARQAVIDRLGLSAEEAALLLG